jgi:uncharacterized protein YndB with AHSA1/START domain
LVADHLQGRAFGAAFGSLTFAFSGAQLLGPQLGGIVADRTGSFVPAFVAASLLSLAGGACAWCLGREERAVRALRRAAPRPFLDSTPVSTTRLTRHIRAPRGRVYRALLDADAVQQWMVPDGMTSEVHAFDAREGGSFRISLTYDLPTETGKTNARTDTFHGRFVRLVPDTEVVQLVEFETDDPAMQGEMTVSYLLADTPDGTEVVGTHADVPRGVSPEDNEVGWTMSMDKLARLVEGG